MAINFSDSTPAAPAGKVNVKWQSDGSSNASAYVDPAVGASASFGLTIDGGGSAITTGQKGYVQLPFGCVITGWSILADQSGSISIELDAQANSAPPSAPVLPDTTTDKISASAPIALSTAQSASSGTSGVSTWSTTRAIWDVFGFNVASVTTVTRVTVVIHVTRS